MTISQILPGLRLFSARTSIGRDYESIYDLGEFMRRKKTGLAHPFKLKTLAHL
jgi:hypothetical protein